MATLSSPRSTDAELGDLCVALGLPRATEEQEREARRSHALTLGITLCRCVDIDANGFCNDCGWSQPGR